MCLTDAVSAHTISWNSFTSSLVFGKNNLGAETFLCLVGNLFLGTCTTFVLVDRFNWWKLDDEAFIKASPRMVQKITLRKNSHFHLIWMFCFFTKKEELEGRFTSLHPCEKNAVFGYPRYYWRNNEIFIAVRAYFWRNRILVDFFVPNKRQLSPLFSNKIFFQSKYMCIGKMKSSHK